MLGAALVWTGCGDDVVGANVDTGIDLPGTSTTTGMVGFETEDPLDSQTGTSGPASETETGGPGCEGDDCVSSMVCGDGVLDEGETCDDGNPRPGDGCSGVCATEPHYMCPTPGEACVSTIRCGDSEIGGPEGCDDGNDDPDDGCSDTCQVEPGFACPAPGMLCQLVETAECGNGMVEFPENCDDGNTAAEDGCSDTCTRESGYACPQPGEPCILDEFCGDGVLNGSEQCDDGNSDIGDGCNGACSLEPFYECPTPGEPCVSTIVCGDLTITGDEACDDGRHCSDGTTPCTDDTACAGIGDESCEPRSGDGCADTCDQVEPGFTCPSRRTGGGPCTPVPTPMCGDAALDFGEFCDDGNTDPDDGCTDECEVTPGYRCENVGQLCERIEYCGNGTRGVGEQCDDGALCEDGITDCSADESVCATIGEGTCTPRGGDGCSATCAVENGYTCPSSGGECTSYLVCGDGIVTSGETCDLGGLCEDGMTDCTDDPSVCAGMGSGACLHADAPGCTSCELEDGWTCTRGGNCFAAECGDGILAGLEFCDDGSHCEDGTPCTDDGDCATGTCIARSLDGCDDSCSLEDGFRCDEPGMPCVATECGDGVVEGTEQCDDLNVELGDGCNPFCQAEPLCDQGPCTSQCGDGIRFAGEGCDDGNRRDGDGCSSDCEEERGFTCEEPTDLPAQIDIPIIIRDFHGSETQNPPEEHVDFEFEEDLGEPRVTDNNIVRESAPECFFDDGGDADPANDRIRGGDLGCADETYAMRNNADEVIATISMANKPIFANLDCNRTAVPSQANGWSKCSATVTDADSFHRWYTERPDGVTAPDWNASPTTVSTLPLVNGSFTTGTFVPGGDAFAFDSRFMSIADPSPTGAEPGFFPIDDLGLTGASCSSGSFNHNFHFTSEVRYWFEYDASVEPTLTFSGDDDVFVYVNGYLALDLGGLHERLEDSFTIDAASADTWGLRDGNIYEIAVFQAEREQCASNYWLTLDGFVPQTSVCEAECGDGILASVEECDDGVNSGEYGTCNSDCTLAPYCGDSEVDLAAGEVCDEGSDFLVYGGYEEACGPDCQIAPYCGDGQLDGEFGEACDDGFNTGEYGTCNPDCTLAPYCGDGAATGTEECDDGRANGTPDSACRTDCTFQCGDGELDAGEECDEGDDNANTYDACQLDCTLGPRCGDGIRQSPQEQCDDGLNNGNYGTCAPMCVLGPRCGDGEVQEAAGERCDNGLDNVSSGYGDPDGCTTRCLPVPYCGDRAVTNDEVCDDGVNDGSPGHCTPACDGFVPLDSCGNGQLDAGEACDAGAQNGSEASGCDTRCRLRCGNGVLESGETCDDGVNDGSYGSCTPECTFAGYCGDGSVDGPEECDQGASNMPNPYGPDLCTTGCDIAPYCGDGRLQPDRGEECDGQVNCTNECTIFIP